MRRAVQRIPLHRRLLRFWFARAERHTLFGITVALDYGSAEERAACVRKIEAALRLIHDHDPRRLRRVRADIDGVFLYNATGGLGRFHPGVRLVTLRFDYVVSKSSSVAEIASTLVHEGTHARLHNLGFDHTPERRARIEAICARSQIAFATRLPDPEPLIKKAEWLLARDPSELSRQAIRQRLLRELAEEGVPPWGIALLERLDRLRERLAPIFRLLLAICLIWGLPRTSSTSSW